MHASVIRGLVLFCFSGFATGQQHETAFSRETLMQASKPIFLPNAGQWPKSVRFAAHSADSWLAIEERGWTWVVRSALPNSVSKENSVHPALSREEQPQWTTSVRFSLVERTDQIRTQPEGVASGRHSFFSGSDPNAWVTDLSGWPAVRVAGEGWAIRFRERDGTLAYDLLLDRGCDLSGFAIQVEGANGLHLALDGELIIETSLGTLRQSRPIAWHGETSCTSEQSARFRILGPDRFGFEVDGPFEVLTIDPELRYATRFGCPQSSLAHAVASAGPNRAWIAFETNQLGMPLTPGGLTMATRGQGDSYVALLDWSLPPTQQVIYGAYLSGSALDFLEAIEVASDGSVFMGGWTYSTDFPTTPGTLQSSFRGRKSGWVAQLDPTRVGASQLRWSTLIGGTEEESVHGLDLSDDGQVVVALQAQSTGLWVSAGAMQRSRSQPFDVYIAILDPRQSGDRQLRYATYYGGNGTDYPRDVIFDAGYVVICGATKSPDLPMVAHAYDSSYSSNGGLNLETDAFLAVIDPRASGSAQLSYSTYLGGHNAETATSVVRLPGGRYAVGGHTSSYTFPTTPGAFRARPWLWGDTDGFVSILDPRAPASAQLIYSTLVGGTGEEQLFDIAFDGAEGLVLGGYTESSDFHTTPNAYQRALSALGVFRLGDGFLVHLLPFAPSSEPQPAFSTYHGGPDGWDGFLSVAMSGASTAVLGGGTNAFTFPTTTNAYQRGTVSGYWDGCLAAVDLHPRGIVERGRSTPDCVRTPRLSASGETRIGSSVRLWSTGMAPLSSGIYLLDPAGLGAPATWLGLELLVDLRSSGVFPVTADAEGRCLLSLPIPPSGWLVGRTMGAQSIWADVSGTPCPPPALSATAALAITFSS